MPLIGSSIAVGNSIQDLNVQCLRLVQPNRLCHVKGSRFATKKGLCRYGTDPWSFGIDKKSPELLNVRSLPAGLLKLGDLTSLGHCNGIE